MPLSSAGIGLCFNLRPFNPVNAPPVALSGCVSRQNRLLQVEFRLVGALHTITLPSRAVQPQRRPELWQQSCFELFFASHGANAYHEVNLSPSGHWNLYRFDSYRKGMREEPNDCLKCHLLPAAQPLVVRMEIDLERIGLREKKLLIGPCAVLLSMKKPPSYWALSHPGDRPDFHNLNGQLLLL